MTRLRIFSYLPNPRVWKVTITARFCGVELEIRGAPAGELKGWLWDYDARPLAEGEADASIARVGRTGLTGAQLFKTDAFLQAHGIASEIARTKDRISADCDVKVSYSPADMAKPAAIREMIETTLAEHGRLDVLVNNAGIQYLAPLDQFPVEKWDASLAMNLSSALPTMRSAPPAMRKNKFGRISTIASAHG